MMLEPENNGWFYTSRSWYLVIPHDSSFFVLMSKIIFCEWGNMIEPWMCRSSSVPLVQRLPVWIDGGYQSWGLGSPRSPKHTLITPQVAVLEAIHGGLWISSHKHHNFQAVLASEGQENGPVFREALCLWFMDSFTVQPEIPGASVTLGVITPNFSLF